MIYECPDSCFILGSPFPSLKDSGLKTALAITVAGAVGVFHPFPHHFSIILVEVYHRIGFFSIEYFNAQLM